MNMEDELGTDIDDAAECSICVDLFEDPKLLPCGHTFCCKCIENYIGTKAADGSCHHCRRPFSIPTEGITQLPGDTLIAKLVKFRKIAATPKCKHVLCDVCAETNEKDGSKSAKWYCQNCSEQLCIRCVNNHERARATKLHQIVEMGRGYNGTNTLTYCRLHNDKQMILYCKDCRLVTCETCAEVGHKTHTTEELNARVKTVRTILQDDASKIQARGKRYLKEREQCRAERSQFLKHVGENRRKISDKIKELIQLVKSHGNRLLEELETIEVDTVKQFGVTEQEISRQMSLLGSFAKCSREIADKATDLDLTCIADDLQKRATELYNTPITCALPSPDIIFSSQDVVETISSEEFNLIGVIATADYQTGQTVYSMARFKQMFIYSLPFSNLDSHT